MVAIKDCDINALLGLLSIETKLRVHGGWFFKFDLGK